MRVATALALVLACTPAAAPQRPAAAPTRSERALPAELHGLVEPWHPLDLELAEAAPVWLLTRYEPGTYPCRPGPDGSLDMLVQDRFTAVQALRGAVRAPGLDLDVHALRGPDYPRAWAAGRRYLLFLRPGPKGQALLADPQALGGMTDRFGADEVLQVIDLDQSEAESRAAEVTATRSSDRLDPTRWEALRAAATVDPAQQQAFAEFLRAEIARPMASIHDVRAWLGAPDGEQILGNGGRQDQYVLARPAYAQPVQDGLYGDLTLRYDARLELRRVELGYLRWRVEPGQSASTKLSADEHAALGLPRLELEFR